jgi:hypothetical protein
MKKLLTLFVILVYGAASVGATLHLHYCCGKLEKITFSAAHNKACPKKDDAFKRCCDSKQVDFKIKADHEPGAKWIYVNKDLTPPFHTAAYYLLTPTQKIPVNEYATGPPLASSPIPLFIKNCVYRI